MPDVQRSIEIERAVNLMGGFGWEKIKEAIDGDRVQIAFEKIIKPGVPESPAP